MTDILIFDDDQAFAETLRARTEACFPGDCSVTVCTSLEAFYTALDQTHPDIALLDVLLDETSGIDLARRYFPRDSGTAVIFVTGYLEYCTDVYEAEHVYFLPKPVQDEKLRRALTKAMAALEEIPCSFSVRIGSTLRRIELREVFCIESFYRKLRIRMRDDVVECYGMIPGLPQEVLARMIHCHKSFLVNPEHVRTMDRQTFLLTNGQRVPISRTRYPDSRKQFLDYCSRHLEGQG